MAQQNVQFLFDSLKGKIRLAAIALAFFVLVGGLVSYLINSFLTTDVFFVILVPFALLAGAVLALGWWFAAEFVRPIEKISLLAKSMERGVSVTLPKTSGSCETDELLQTLQRNHQQLQTLVGLMDKVAAGDLEVALAPLENSDRLSVSFQKLLAKVSDSIHAKQNLDKLQTAVGKITREIYTIEKGNFDVEIASDSKETKEIADAFKYLIQNLNDLISQIKSGGANGQSLTNEALKTIRTIVESGEMKIQQMSPAKLSLKQIPESALKISAELSASAAAANQAIESARAGTQTAKENLDAVNLIRKQIRESVKKIQKLSERSLEIAKVAKTVEDLSQRTSLIALNASLQAANSNAKNGEFGVIAEEVERLAARAENTNRQISSLNKTISAEIGEVEHSLQATINEAANLSKFAIETGNSIGELEKYAAQVLNLQTKLVSHSSEQTNDAEKAFLLFAESISETENAVKKLKESEAHLAQISNVMVNLQLSVADFKVSAPVAEEISIIGEYAAPPEIVFEENT